MSDNMDDTLDTFNRLRKKAGERSTVPPRNTAIVKDPENNLLNDQKTDFSHSVNEDEAAAPAEAIHDRLETASEEIKSLETVRRTIRLEQEIDSQLEALCSKQKVTRETFLEAALILCNDNEEFLKLVLTEAKKRYKQRKATGEQRKFQTIAKKFGNL